MTSLDPKFTVLHRSAIELMAPQLTWEQIRDKIGAQFDWMVSPRPTELRCGAGVPDWLKRVLPTVRDPESVLDISRYAGIRIIKTDDLPPGRYAVMDQYGSPMLEGEVPA